MAQAPQFRSFDGETEEWELYREQLEQYFEVNQVADEMKKAVLINHCGARTYKLLRDLCTPQTPAEKTYEQLCELLSTHFTPPVVVHKERRHFMRAERQEGESLNAWSVRLKNLASNCKMGDHLQHDLLNKFVDGLEGKAYDRICEEDENLTFERAYEIALKYEPEVMKASRLFQFERGKQPFGRGLKKKNNAAGESRCLACNKPGHFKRECRFKEYACRGCGKRGHLQAACSSQRNFFVGEQDGDDRAQGDADEINMEQNFISKSRGGSIYALDGPVLDAPMMISVSVSGRSHKMQLDTGAAISAVSMAYYVKELKQVKLKETNLCLTGYGGEKLKVKGVIEPIIEFGGNEKKVTFAVVEDGGPPLLGRNFVRDFNIGFSSIHAMDSRAKEPLEALMERHRNLFSPGVGTYKHGTVKIELEDHAQPIFRKPRPVAFKLVDKVTTELDEMERDGIITKCDNSKWGTPLVPVVKGDGKIRLCGDYKGTVNRYVKDVIHPLPTVEEVFSKLNGGKKFSKLDLSKCYNQFLLDDESKEICAISTTKGVYKMNRLPFGVRPASGIVQRELERLLCGIKGVQNFIDDVLVSGDTDEEHLENLAKVFAVLEEAGLKLNQEKCLFFKKEVTYLGHVISAEGLRKTDESVKAIQEAREPKNVQEVRAFAGLVNHYSRFVKDMAAIMSPLYVLLKKGARFVWTSECQAAFCKVKQEICKDVSLTHFDPNAKLYLICDASAEGVSAVLAQKDSGGRERPVAFASRVLHAAEKNYSVIDREGLAVVYGLNKFYHYLIGNTFTIRTDHKPLVSIFNPHKGIPAIAASRMQRWANFLAGFCYKIEHVSSQDNIADFPSRFPHESWKLWKEDDSYLNFVNTSDLATIDCNVMRKEAEIDAELVAVKEFLRTGSKSCIKPDNPYRKFLGELSLEAELVMRGMRVVVPRSLRKCVLEQLHRSHMGIVKSKSILRSFVWWPGVDEQLEQFIKNCSVCLVNKPSPEKAELIPWEPPQSVWSRVHLDFAGPVNGVSFLIVIDALSKWIEVFPTRTCNTEFVLEKLLECISRFGIMKEIVCDNGPQFTAAKFQNFLNANAIRLVLTSPGHPATNGQAENAVKTFKSSLLKSLTGEVKDVREVIANFLLGYRNAAHCATGISPAKMMMGRQLRTSLSLMQPGDASKPTAVEDFARQTILEKQDAQIRNYKGSRNMQFNVDDRVVVRDYTDPNKPSWTPGVVVKVLGRRNYTVKLLVSGRHIKRHLNQMRRDTRQNEIIQKPQVSEVICSKTKRVETLRPRRMPIMRTVLRPVSGEGENNVPLRQSGHTDDGIERQQGIQQSEVRATDEEDGSGGGMQMEESGSGERRVNGENGQEECVQVDGSGTEERERSEEERSAQERQSEYIQVENGERRSEVEDEDDGQDDSLHIQNDKEDSEDHDRSVDSDESLELAGFERGTWKFRDYLGRLIRK